MRLWKTLTCPAWHDALERYPDVIVAQHVNGLVKLDEWYRVALPQRIAVRAPAYITRVELERVIQWKMKRGVWRERNRLLALSNPILLVKQTSRNAMATASDPRHAITLLCQLAGVGPASASAILACHSPALYPFFDELVAIQVPRLGQVAFTLPYYLRYAAQLAARAEQLNQVCAHRIWTAEDASQALWSASGGKVAHPELK